MAFKVDKKLISINYTKGRPGWNGAPFIVEHTYNGMGTSLYGWFNNPSSGVSAHFAVMHDGTIEQYVELDDTAWANGNAFANANGVSIEHQDNARGEYTDLQLQASAWLVKNVINPWAGGRIAYNEAGITKHSKWAETGCPGHLPIDKIISYLNQSNTMGKYFFEGREVTVDNIAKAIVEFRKEPRIIRQENIKGADVQAEFWEIKARQDAIELKDKSITALQGEIKALNDKVSTRDEMIKVQQEDNKRLLNSYNLEVENNNTNKKEILRLKKEIEELKQSNSFEKFIFFGFDTGLYKRKTLIN